jgi:hypothetical protein
MKRIRTYATLAGLVITGTAVAVLPVTVSTAAVACAPAWTASAVYVNGNTASYHRAQLHREMVDPERERRHPQWTVGRVGR